MRSCAPTSLVVAVVALTAGCTREAADTGGGRLVVETATTAGGTTVRNASGSIWERTVRLVEEFSLGVGEGDEAEMFGRISGLWVAADRLYVLDWQLPALRLYALDGTHLQDVGRPGEGPGEFLLPFGLAVRPDGSAAVYDVRGQRMVFFESDGSSAGAWRPDDGFLAGVDVLAEGSLLVRTITPSTTTDSRTPAAFQNRSGVARLGRDLQLAAIAYPPDLGFVERPLVIEVNGRIIQTMSELFAPRHHWAPAPDGSLVAGVSDRYRYEIHAPDGRVTTVERYWDPVAISRAEADDAVAQLEAGFRDDDPDWQYPGGPIPPTKPAFRKLSVDRDSRVWLERELDGRVTGDCGERIDERSERRDRAACWTATVVLDVFAPDGRYLGEVQRPRGLRFGVTFVRGTEYWAAVEDDEGVAMVKRFRIVADG